MNQYIATLGGAEIARIADDINLHPHVMQTVGVWIRAGFTVRIHGGSPLTTATPRPSPVKPPVRRRTVRRMPAMPEPVTTPIQELAGWHIGDRVYLAWSQIIFADRVHLSQYRTIAGIIERFRSDAVAVRFNSDPEPIWLRPGELAAVPEV